MLCAILGRTAGRTPVLLLVDRDEKHHPNTDMGKRRMTVSEREQRRKLRKLMKMVDFVPAHKKALATALVQLASRSEGAEERKTLERLDRLTDVANEGRQVAARPDLEQHLRDIDSGAVTLDPCSASSTRISGGSVQQTSCLLYTSPSPRDAHESRMPSSA